MCNYVGLVNAQSLQQTPYSASDSVRRGLSGPLDLSPSNPLGLPGSSLLGPRGSDSIPISSGLFQGILPNIPNLQLGYIYNFGQSVRAGRASVDYLLPINLSPDTTVYGEAHGEFQSFWKTTPGSSNNRTDLSLGGGYRRMLGSKALVGINGFYDTSRLYGDWYSSGSAGVEMAAEISGNDAIDLNFNWYGRLFNTSVLSNAFRYGPSNYDFQVGYSHELWNNGPDLRLSATGYKFDVGSNVYGYYGQGELKSRDGMFVLKSNIGYDRLNQTYYTVGGYINMGFQVENLFSGKSPLTMPEPIFKSPRNLRRLLTKTADRNWYQPTSVVVNRNYTPVTTPTPTPDPPTPDPPAPTCNSFCRTTPTRDISPPIETYSPIWPWNYEPFNEGDVLSTELTNDCCVNVSFDWTSTDDSTQRIIVYIATEYGYAGLASSDSITHVVYLSGRSGHFSISDNERQSQWKSDSRQPLRILGLYMEFPGNKKTVTIHNPLTCFNKSCQ